MLAEIANNMLPISVYGAAIFLSGASAAVAFTFLRGAPRLLVMTLIVCGTGFLAVELQVDRDLVEAVRSELGDGYITISRCWIIASIVLALVLLRMIRGFFRLFDTTPA